MSAARRDPNFFIVARTDAMGVTDLDDAIRRLEAYAAVGADGLYVDAPRSVEQLKEIARRLKPLGLPLLFNMVRSGKSPVLSLNEVHELGFDYALCPVEPLLAMLQFGDGAAAALVTAEPRGFAIDRPFATTLPDSDALIRWNITDHGFAMHLSGEVPARIATALADTAFRTIVSDGHPPGSIDGWAVHAGGRSILDAVEHAMQLKPDALDASRRVLAENGNMSSATLMFVFERLLAGPPIAHGVALAFGPGLAAEGFGFRSAA